MKVITCVSDRRHPDFQRFLRASCAHHDLELTTLVFRGRWTTHRIKDLLLRRYLRTIPADTLILFADGYDTIFLCAEDEILAKYRAAGAPIVFTAEKNCWPCPELADLYPHSPTAFRYLNSGGFIGPAGLLLDLLDRYLLSPPGLADRQELEVGIPPADAPLPPLENASLRWSNQFFWTLVFLKHRELVTLDHEPSIFLELAPELARLEESRAELASRIEGSALYHDELKRIGSECTVHGSRLHHAATGTTPCILHFNGPVAKRIARTGFFAAAMPWLGRWIPLSRSGRPSGGGRFAR
jgi:hypothetical protein